ncbi:hypothetical protein HK405_002728, partial [Cladochytrium tenue]
ETRPHRPGPDRDRAARGARGGWPAAVPHAAARLPLAARLPRRPDRRPHHSRDPALRLRLRLRCQRRRRPHLHPLRLCRRRQHHPGRSPPASDKPGRGAAHLLGAPAHVPRVQRARGDERQVGRQAGQPALLAAAFVYLPRPGLGHRRVYFRSDGCCPGACRHGRLWPLARFPLHPGQRPASASRQ